MSLDHFNFGGGSGGAGVNVPPQPAQQQAPQPPPPPPCTKHTDSHEIDGTYTNKANQMELRAEPPQPPAPIDPCKILLFSCNPLTQQGEVNVRGEAGVRITTGPAHMPEIEKAGILGLEVETFDLHKIKLTRGVTPPNIQLITMDPTDGILIDGAPLTVKVNSMMKIEMTVGPGTITMEPASIKAEIGASQIAMDPAQIKIAVGANSITINAMGITIQGLPAVNIN